MRQCSATSKQTGLRCKRYTGDDQLSVCRFHGGAAPQTQAAARERRALVQAMTESPARSAPEVLLYALHLADVLTQWEAAGTGDVDELIQAIELSARLAGKTMDLGVQERLTLMYEETARVLLSHVEQLLDGLDLTPEQVRRVPGLLTAGLEAMTGREIGPPAIES